MASRVLKGSDAQALPPIEWRNLSSSGASAASGAGPRPATPPPDTALLEQQAYERGCREGQAAGQRLAREEWQAAIQGFASSVAELAGYKPVLRAEAEREMVELALAVARKILRRELSIDANIVLAVLRSCLEDLRQIDVYRLRVHPQDAGAVAGFFEQHRQTQVEVIPDPQLTRGGALLETSRGQLDARLETQLIEIERGLADR